MEVYKFGGASISSIERTKNTAGIIKGAKEKKLLIVVSALGKTTNALEKVTEAFFDNRQQEALQLFEEVKTIHLDFLKQLVVREYEAAGIKLKDFFTEVEWMLHDKPVRPYDYYYDQIVCVGELLSSHILSFYLSEINIKNDCIDVRDIIRTDNNFRDASVDSAYTSQKIREVILPVFQDCNIIITQGFIGSTDENESTTLGREGSDYTAAIFASLLPAEAVTIWKDVEAIMSSDPKEQKKAVKIPALSYTEVIEMAYYGAQVIHPKTIKPLQNANIPLYVKSFIKPKLPGTVINNIVPKNMPPIIVMKQNQVLIKFKSKDFSFTDEPALELDDMFKKLRLKSNLSQHTAISLLYCFDDHAEKPGQLASQASEIYDVEMERGLTLLTIRHYDEATLNKLTKGMNIILMQKTVETVQVLMRAAVDS